MIASLLLLTLSGKSLLFCPSAWLPEVDLVRMQSSVKVTAQVGGHISSPNAHGPVFSCTVVCRCYVLDSLVK